jgi:hypothetical protein
VTARDPEDVIARLREELEEARAERDAGRRVVARLKARSKAARKRAKERREDEARRFDELYRRFADACPCGLKVDHEGHVVRNDVAELRKKIAKRAERIRGAARKATDLGTAETIAREGARRVDDSSWTAFGGRAVRYGRPMSERALRVYVAGSGLELVRVRAWLKALRDIGVEITVDWTDGIEASIAKGGDAMLTDEERVHRATNDLTDGIDRADIVWFLAPVTASRGAYIELGYALAKHKLVCASGLAVKRTIFTSLAQRVFEADADAFVAIADYVKADGYAHA